MTENEVPKSSELTKARMALAMFNDSNASEHLLPVQYKQRLSQLEKTVEFHAAEEAEAEEARSAGS